MVCVHIRDIHLLISSSSASLRPADANPLKQTKGRKSNKRAFQKISKEHPDALDEDKAPLVEESVSHANCSQANARTLKRQAT